MKTLIRSLLIWLCVAAYACSDNKEPVNGEGENGHDHDEKTVQSWICSRMCDWYLWNEDVQAKNPDYTLGWEDFFKSLLSTNRSDGKSNGSTYSFYSYIERIPAGSRANVSHDLGFGFEFFLQRVDLNASEKDNIYAVVQYVVDGSPAYVAGLRRGDRISKINGTRMKYSNYTNYYPYLLDESYTGSPASTITVEWCRLEFTGGTYTSGGATYRAIAETNIRSDQIVPGPVEDNPVHYSDVITTGSGKKVGYVVYNAFERGDNNQYDNDLKNVFTDFKKEGVQDVVLDLRYNNGGYVTSALLLSSMLAPQSKLGSKAMKMTYNQTIIDKYGSGYDAWYNFLTVSQMSGNNYGSEPGTNLDLKRLYVLVTGSSASASELIINNLRGIDVPVYLIGETTAGKNVGMTRISPEDNLGGSYDNYDYHMWPVTFYSYNAKSTADYDNGFSPDFEYRESGDIELLDFGKEEESLLYPALYHIENSRFPSSSRKVDKMDINAAPIILSIYTKRPAAMLDTGMRETSDK